MFNEIFLPVNFKQIQNMTFDHPAFQQLVPILPFAIELNKLIEEFNSPGFFQKDYTIKSGVLWRGINLNETQKSKFIKSKGEKIGFAAFSSSTKLKSKTEEFMPTVLIRFTFPPINYKMIYPIDISPFSIFENEAEVLFPAGSEFIIKTARYEKEIPFYKKDPICEPKIDMIEEVHNKHDMSDNSLIYKTFPVQEDIINDLPIKDIITDKQPEKTRLIIELEYIPTPKMYKGKLSYKLMENGFAFITRMNLEEIRELTSYLKSKSTDIYIIQGI